jgi:hypothetical protein
MVNGGSNGPGPSLGFGAVNHCSILHQECGLVMLQIGQLGFNGCSLAGEFALPLRCPVLNVNLPSMGLRLLFLLICLLLLTKEPNAWLWCGGPQRDHQVG